MVSCLGRMPATLLMKVFFFLACFLPGYSAPPDPDPQVSLGQLLLQDLQGTGGTCKKAIQFAKASLQIPDQITTDIAALNPHNAERDLLRWVSRQTWRRLMPALYNFKIDINKRGESAPSEHSAFLPHEVFHTLYEYGPEGFWKIMGSPDDLLEFWRGALS